MDTERTRHEGFLRLYQRDLSGGDCLLEIAGGADATPSAAHDDDAYGSLRAGLEGDEAHSGEGARADENGSA
jgi:hypothetical protein